MEAQVNKSREIRKNPLDVKGTTISMGAIRPGVSLHIFFSASRSNGIIVQSVRTADVDLLANSPAFSVLKLSTPFWRKTPFDQEGMQDNEKRLDSR
ncbi:hypothetical protein [Paenibacillus sp. TH7-28]